MLGNSDFTASRAAWKKFMHPPGELFHVLAIQLGPPFSFPLPVAGSDLAVGQTFLFGLVKGFTFHQQPPPLIPFARPAPLQYHRA
jgi:hypothetical protein